MPEMQRHSQKLRGIARHPGYQPKLPPKSPLLSPRGCIIHITRSWRLCSIVGNIKPESESRRNLKPTKPAVQISDVDHRRKILITDKCTTTFREWRDKGESFRLDRYRCIHVAVYIKSCLQRPRLRKRGPRSLASLEQEPYNLSPF
jgi:hypothetical protein